MKLINQDMEYYMDTLFESKGTLEKEIYSLSAAIDVYKAEVKNLQQQCHDEFRHIEEHLDRELLI